MNTIKFIRKGQKLFLEFTLFYKYRYNDEWGWSDAKSKIEHYINSKKGRLTLETNSMTCSEPTLLLPPDMYSREYKCEVKIVNKVDIKNEEYRSKFVTYFGL